GQQHRVPGQTCGTDQCLAKSEPCRCGVAPDTEHDVGQSCRRGLDHASASRTEPRCRRNCRRCGSLIQAGARFGRSWPRHHRNRVTGLRFHQPSIDPDCDRLKTSLNHPAAKCLISTKSWRKLWLAGLLRRAHQLIFTPGWATPAGSTGRFEVEKEEIVAARLRLKTLALFVAAIFAATPVLAGPSLLF